MVGQIVRLCEQAGLAKLGHVALDGMKANASKHKAMSYERMGKRAAELEAEVKRWLSAAEAADAAEDKPFGPDKSGEELPKWIADTKKRDEKIRAAKAELEAEAKAAAAAKAKAQAEAEHRPQAEGRKNPGKPAAAPSDEGADPRHDTPDTGVRSATADQRAEAIHRGMARLLRLLPNSASPHEPRSVNSPKIAFVSLAAMANQAKPLRGVAPSRRSKVPRSGRSWFTDRTLAYVRTSGGPTSRTQRQFQVARSSPNLCAAQA